MNVSNIPSWLISQSKAMVPPSVAWKSCLWENTDEYLLDRTMDQNSRKKPQTKGETLNIFNQKETTKKTTMHETNYHCIFLLQMWYKTCTWNKFNQLLKKIATVHCSSSTRRQQFSHPTDVKINIIVQHASVPSHDDEL